MWAAPAQAAAPHVVTDIAPVHSLVSQVLGDVGSADVLISGNATPHDFSLRPSLAKALAKADIIFRVGSELTPWLDGPLKKLAANAQAISLLKADSVTRLPAREDAQFAAHQHEGADDHTTDPHAWLDPNNALLWLDVIALTLAQFDQQHAKVYQQNAMIAKAALIATHEQLKLQLEPLAGKPFLVYHDSFQYFEHHFKLKAMGSIAASDARRPGPARVERVRRLVKNKGIRCVMGEPQFNASLVHSVAPMASVVTVDVLGAKLTPGAQLYNELLIEVGDALERCLQ